MKILNSEKIKLVMAKDWWETEDLDGKIEKLKVSEDPYVAGMFGKAFIEGVQAGEKVTVTMELDPPSHYDTQAGCWLADRDYTLEIGKNANRIVLTQRITL